MDAIQKIKMLVSFQEGILKVNFVEGISITVDDVRSLYQYGIENSGGEDFCLLYHNSATFQITEEAVYYSVHNPDHFPILAKAYVVHSQADRIRMKLHLMFDKPVIVPGVYESEIQAVKELRSCLKTHKEHNSLLYQPEYYQDLQGLNASPSDLRISKV